MEAWRAAQDDQLQAERDLAAACGEQYAHVIEIGPLWDVGAPLPHLISNGSRAFVACLASPGWDGTFVNVVWPADADPSLFVVIEMWGCSQIRFGGPNDEAMSGHPLHGKGPAAGADGETIVRWVRFLFDAAASCGRRAGSYRGGPPVGLGGGPFGRV
jgi:hypothetical protein